MKTKIYDVYQPWDITLVKANGAQIEDENGKKYFDCYGGHGVISIGHNHPAWKKALVDQLDKISYYSNALKIKKQEEIAELLSEVS